MGKSEYAHAMYGQTHQAKKAKWDVMEGCLRFYAFHAYSHCKQLDANGLHTMS
jgi:hypothetical protein